MEIYTRKNFKNHIFKFQLSLFRIPWIPCTALSSRILLDNKHMLFLDWDNVNKKIVENDISYLTEKYMLCPFILFQSDKRNWKTICPQKFTFKQCVKMQEETHCDKKFTDGGLKSKYRSWGHRTTTKGRKQKPKFLDFIGKENTKNKVFFPAIKTLQELYPKLKNHPYKNLDTNSNHKIGIINYLTNKNCKEWIYIGCKFE